MVKCGVCGKEHDGYESYYMARRSETVMRIGGGPHGTWDYFGVAPVFFACSQSHYNILVSKLAAEKVISDMSMMEKIDMDTDAPAAE